MSESKNQVMTVEQVCAQTGADPAQVRQIAADAATEAEILASLTSDDVRMMQGLGLTPRAYQEMRAQAAWAEWQRSGGGRK